MIDIAGVASDALVRAIPLLLTGLAVALAFRSGIWNIGADGQLLAGATLAAAIGMLLHGVSSPFGLLLVLMAGTVAGACWSGVAVILRRYFRVSEVISTIMLNFLAINLLSYLVRGPLQEPTHIYPQTPSISESLRLPVIWGHTRVHFGLVIALLIAAGMWAMFRFTATGFRLRAAGTNPTAARTTGGINPQRISASAMLWSGALAGIAGAIELSGVTFSLYENLSPGYGYTAIAVALLGQLHPVGIVGTAFFFGALESFGNLLQRDFNIPSSVVLIAEAVLVLGLLGLDWVRARTSRRFFLREWRSAN